MGGEAGPRGKDRLPPQAVYRWDTLSPQDSADNVGDTESKTDDRNAIPSLGENPAVVGLPPACSTRERRLTLQQDSAFVMQRSPQDISDKS